MLYSFIHKVVKFVHLLRILYGDEEIVDGLCCDDLSRLQFYSDEASFFLIELDVKCFHVVQ